jgi:hypothetical protein
VLQHWRCPGSSGSLLAAGAGAGWLLASWPPGLEGASPLGRRASGNWLTLGICPRCNNRLVDDTRDALLDSLTAQRRHVLGILEGLDDVALRRPVLPTGWSCVGLVQHLAIDVERFWFRAVMAHEPEAWTSLEQLDSAWRVSDSTAPASVLALYRSEILRADDIIRSMPIDAPPARWPEDLFGSFRLTDLGEVMLHVITETACHAGHLDVVRELIDGRTWMVL